MSSNPASFVLKYNQLSPINIPINTLKLQRIPTEEFSKNSDYGLKI
tara:strand:- start:19 stop:156 length:138 start_codon:yes stop_codon:yes gene_type:complete